MEKESKTSQLRSTFQRLKTEASTLISHCQEIAEFFSPEDGQFLVDSDKYEGEKVRSSIINGTPGDAANVLAAGLLSGLVSPSRPWFTFKLADEKLMEFGPVRNWIHDARNVMLQSFSRSNFYGSMFSNFYNLGLFGTAAMAMVEDWDTVLRFRPFAMGEYYLTLDARYKPCGLYRKIRMTVRQMVQEFGLDVCSTSVQHAYSTNHLEQKFWVFHAVYPNSDRDPKKLDYRGQRYKSVYFEESGDPDKFLSEKGFANMPFVAPRWDVKGINTYGSSPAMRSLGDAKMLQLEEEKKLKALDKMVDPPMNAPASMRQDGGTIVAGGVNYIDTNAGGQRFEPAYLLNPNFQAMAFEINTVETRIKRQMHYDMFLALLNETKQMTATEVVKKFEEKLVVLGPFLDRLQSEALDPVVEASFAKHMEMGAFPPIPEEIRGMDLKVEYISSLAQAQRMVGLGSIEQTLTFAVNLSQSSPSVLDKIDFDEAVDQYGMMTGVPPKIIRSDDDVAKLREAKAQEAQKQQAMAMAESAAKTTKTLADSQMDTNSALDGLMGGRIR